MFSQMKSQHKMCRLFFCKFQSVFAILRRDHALALLCKVIFQHFSDILLVIYRQYRLCHFVFLLRQPDDPLQA